MEHTKAAPIPHSPDLEFLDEYRMRLDGHTFLNPYFLAEQIPSNVHDEIDKSKNINKVAWNHVERGLSMHDANTVYTSRYFFQCIAEESSPQLRVQADMVLANIGLLALRANKINASAVDIHNSYRTVATVASRLLNGHYGDIHHGTYKGMLSEAVSYGLIVRPAHRGYIPYFGSKREESSKLIHDNHDLYVISDTTKAAIQIKHGRRIEDDEELGPRYTKQLTMSTHILDALGPDMFEESEAVESVAKLMAQEVDTPHPPATKEDFILAKLSLATLGVVSEHQNQMRDLPNFRSFPYRPKPKRRHRR